LVHVYQVHLITTWEGKIKVLRVLHTSIHLHCTCTFFCGIYTHWKTLKVLKIIFWNLWRRKLINMSRSHVNYPYLYQLKYNLACFTYFHTCWGSLIRRALPWTTSRIGLQVIKLVWKDGMNGLTSCLWLAWIDIIWFLDSQRSSKSYTPLLLYLWIFDLSCHVYNIVHGWIVV
jgi:hypothetical protein